jgi:hypothetical protein
MSSNHDLRFFAEYRFLKSQRQILAQVCASLSASATLASAAKEIAKAEEIPENVVQVLECAGIDSAHSTADSGVTKAIVSGALVAVGEDGVRLAAFFELFFRVWIVGIAVRMILQRQFAVGALNFLLAGFAGNTQDFVVIAFYFTGQRNNGSLVL